jgi:hypothetical protein
LVTTFTGFATLADQNPIAIQRERQEALQQAAKLKQIEVMADEAYGEFLTANVDQLNADALPAALDFSNWVDVTQNFIEEKPVDLVLQKEFRNKEGMACLATISVFNQISLCRTNFFQIFPESCLPNRRVFSKDNSMGRIAAASGECAVGEYEIKKLKNGVSDSQYPFENSRDFEFLQEFVK